MAFLWRPPWLPGFTWKIFVRMATSFTVPASQTSARYAINFTDWTPSAAEWSECCCRVEAEELTRIHRFVFQKDAKAALVGRLLLRSFLSEALQVKNSALVFGRTEKGKPFLKEPLEKNDIWSFNISHSGNFLIFGAEKNSLIGIDVMKTETPKFRKTLADYFTLMHSQFTSREWAVIQTPSDDVLKLRNFYRLWCLKESYVKALGVGIGYNVSRLDFDLPVDPAQDRPTSLSNPVQDRPTSLSDLVQDRPISLSDPVQDRPISLTVDGTVQTGWTFTEFTVDSQHLGAVALKAKTDVLENKHIPELVFLTVAQLVQRLEPIGRVNSDWGTQFTAKADKP